MQKHLPKYSIWPFPNENMCISESAYLFRLYWFKCNEKFNSDSTNKASIDLRPIEVMANPTVLLMLDRLSEIRIIWKHKAWVYSSRLSSLTSLCPAKDLKKPSYHNKQGFSMPSTKKHNTDTHILLASNGDCIRLLLKLLLLLRTGS